MAADATGWIKVPGGPGGQGILQWVGSGPAPATSGSQQVALRNSLGFGSAPTSGGTGGLDLSGLFESMSQGGPEGGGNITLTSQTKNEMPKWLLPYAQNFVKQYSNLALPGGKPMQMPAGMNQQVAAMQPQEMQGLGMVNQVSPQAGALAGAGAGSLFNTLAGNYLSPQTNPYLGATYEAAARPMVANYMYGTAPSQIAAAQRAGQMGSSAYNESAMLDQFGLGANLTDLAANIFGKNYGDERNRMASAQAFTPSAISSMYAPANAMIGAGAYQRSANQQGLDAAFGNATRATEFPFSILSGMGGALGQAGMGTGSSTSASTIPSAFLPQQQQSSSLPSWLPLALGGGGLLGAAAPALGSLFSSAFGSGNFH